MADKKISQLTSATTPLAGTEELPIVQSGSTVKVSVDNLTAGKTVKATTFDTDVAAAGVTLTGTTLAADGTDTNIDINITPKGTGEVNLAKVDIDGGAIDGTAIGAGSASTGAFTTLSASGDITGSSNVSGARLYSSILQQSIADNTWVTFFTLADSQGSSYLVTAAKARSSDLDSHVATMIVTKDGAQTAAAVALASAGGGVELQLSGAEIQAQRVSPYGSGGLRGVIVSILRLT
jgi:hypothetical protein